MNQNHCTPSAYLEEEKPEVGGERPKGDKEGRGVGWGWWREMDWIVSHTGSSQDERERESVCVCV